MPSKSPAQAHLMRAVANSPDFARKVGIPESVGREFARADQTKGERALKAPKIHGPAPGYGR